MFEENNQEKRMNKSLIYAVAGVALLVIAVSGSAYAYFTASASSPSDAISGKTLDIQMSVASVEMVSKGTGDLIPIYDGTVTGHASQLSTATNSTNDCVDKNGYTVCQIYKVTINNNGTNSTNINTTITLNGTNDVKWARMTARNTFDTILPTSQTANLNTSVVVLPAKSGTTAGTTTQYFVVYLMNTGDNQTTADGGKTITGTVTVTASTGSRIEATFS